MLACVHVCCACAISLFRGTVGWVILKSARPDDGVRERMSVRVLCVYVYAHHCAGRS